MLLCPEICVCMQSTLWGQTSILTKVARKVHSFKIPWTEQHLETAKVANNDSSSLEIQEKKKKNPQQNVSVSFPQQSTSAGDGHFCSHHVLDSMFF